MGLVFLYMYKAIFASQPMHVRLFSQSVIE